MIPLLVVCLVVLVGGPVQSATAQPSDGPDVVRIGGENRYRTAAKVAARFEPGVPRVFLATGVDFPDALAAVPIAGRAEVPILLVQPERIPPATVAALRDLAPGSITILGGAAAVGQEVVVQARGLTDGPVRRISGDDRYATAAELVGRNVDPGVPVVYVAAGGGFADSIAGGPAAVSEGGAMLLVRKDRIPPEARAALRELDPGRIVILGGTDVVSADVQRDLAGFTDGDVTRLAGEHRYDTAARIAHEVFRGVRSRAWFTTGTDFPDGLVGGVLAGMHDQPLVTVRQDCVPDRVHHEVERMDVDRVMVLGGTDVVGDDAAHLLPCLPGDGIATSTVQRDLDSPWDLVFTPDDRVFLTERDTGLVLERRPDGTMHEVISFADEIDNDHEGGLTGLAVDPDYDPDVEATQWLYALYVHQGEDAQGDEYLDQRVMKFRPDGTEEQPVIVGLPHDGGQSHFAGRIDFGPDDKLYVAIGDVRDHAAAQDLYPDPLDPDDRDHLKGKILRYDKDGSVPTDNPFSLDPDDPFGSPSPVWAFGFRDPQGMAWDDQGRMYVSEFGPNDDDEINRVDAGDNHGWPCVRGTGTRTSLFDDVPSCAENVDDFRDPIVVRQPPEASWSGISIVPGDSALPAWEGDLFVAALRGQRLYRVDLEDGAVRGVEEMLVEQYGRLRHVVPAPDGSLWIITGNHNDNGDPAPGDDRIVRLGP